MNHNNLEDKNATKQDGKVISEGRKVNFLNYFICCKGHLKLTSIELTKNILARNLY